MRYVTLDSAKAKAPLDALCHHLGIQLGWDDRAACPFHDDHDPSFYLWYGNGGEQRWWCQVCGFGGDQIDLLRKLRGVGFAEAITMLDSIAEDLPSSVPRRRPPRDPESDMRTLQHEVAEAMSRATEPDADGYISAYAVGFVDESNPDDRFEWDAFLRQLGWGVDDLGRVVMPHWDHHGALTGAKIRRPDGSRVAVPGSTFRHLYPAWWPQRHQGVVLTEGETDCAWAMRQTDAYDVRSIPRGAPGLASPLNSDDQLNVADLMRWDEVWLAFDGDSAGNEATDRWWSALHQHTVVRIVEVPMYEDLRSSGRTLHEMMSWSVS